MDRRISITSTRGGYERFRESPVTSAQIADNYLSGPFTRPDIIALLWRVKKLRIVASVTATATKEVFNETTEEFETVTTNYTRDVDEVLELVYPSNWSSEELQDEQIPDDDFLYAVTNSNEHRFRSVGEESGTTGGLFYFLCDQYSNDVGKDTGGALWIYLYGGAGTAVTGDAGLTVWEMKYGAAAGDDVTTKDFTGTLQIYDNTVNLVMRVRPSSTEAGDNTAITAASFAITVEEWRPYATTAGAGAWNATTGAPVNGGPGA